MIGKMILDINAKDFSMELDIPFGQLNVIAGMNGVGKTFVMKTAWLAGILLQFYKVTLVMAPGKVDELFAEEAKKMFRYTFDNAEELNGSIMIQDEEEEIYRFVVSFKDGTVDYFNVDLLNPAKFSIGNIQSIQFNSKEARTFTQYAQYQKLKTRFGITDLTEEAIEEICEFFKIYDVIWFEHVYQKLQHMIQNGLDPAYSEGIALELFHDVFEGKSKLIGVEEDSGVPVFVFEDASKKKATELGTGHQSMLMIALFQ